MHVPWGRIAPIAGAVATTIIKAVPMLEQVSRRMGPIDGEHKRQTIMDIVRADLAHAEYQCGWNLSNDPEVRAAIGVLIDAVVALNNVVARAVLTPR